MGTKFGLLTAEQAMKYGYIPARVYVDGVEYDNVVTVNDAEGWIEINKSDSVKGCPYVEYENGDPEKPYIPTERIHGDVVYEPFKKEGAQ